MNIKYLVYKEYDDIKIGLRQRGNYYYLDFIGEVNNEPIIVNKYKKHKKEYKYLFNVNNKDNINYNLIYETIINSIIHDFLLNVKSQLNITENNDKNE